MEPHELEQQESLELIKDELRVLLVGLFIFTLVVIIIKAFRFIYYGESL